MSRTYVLGGSPLGLMNLQSRPNRDGMSTFNGGDSRDVNVNDYNRGKRQLSNIVDGSKRAKTTVSLFTGGAITKFWGNIGNYGQEMDRTGLTTKYKGINRADLHNDTVYDTSILNIIEKLSYSPKTALRPQDFAYLKHLGVYPNNRLMIARKFTDPQPDNIMSTTGAPPIAVLISWKPMDEDFLDFAYGEIWEDAKADFTDVLNSFGEKFGLKGTGTGSGKGLNVLPLPGVTETIQRQVLTALGILEKDGDEPLPSGNPNIIKQAKKRKTVGYSEANSGLMAKISIKMNVEYELKFISGIDPTVVWMDILSNVLAFGTQNSQSYGLSADFVDNLNKWTQRGGAREFSTFIVEKIKDGLENAIETVQKLVQGLLKDEDETEAETPVGKTRALLKNLGFEGDAMNIAKTIIDSMKTAIGKTIELYRIEVMGIGHALSGLPSTPWHITIGNPLRPIFCSGDMLTQNVKVTLGNQLSFNDLPTSIKVEFTLENARPLGMQEIISKFNSGYLRVVNVRRDFTTFGVDGAGDYYDNIDMSDAIDIKALGEMGGSKSKGESGSSQKPAEAILESSSKTSDIDGVGNTVKEMVPLPGNARLDAVEDKLLQSRSGGKVAPEDGGDEPSSNPKPPSE